MKVLEVLNASCKDCHRCLRECAVKAIAFEDDQASIIDEKCIYCGRCINECPQEAKVPRNETSKLQSYIDSDQRIAVSLAPSFAAGFSIQEPYKVVGALKETGIDYVAETSLAAEKIAAQYKELLLDRYKPLVSTCCPAVVNLVEKHYPEVIPYLAPIVSPMNIHAEMLKKQYGRDTRVVFVGPCIAKIDEAERHQGDYKVDVVLTFDQVKEYLADKEISIYDSQPVDFDEGCFSKASSYPIEQGAIKAAGLDQNIIGKDIISASGVEKCREILEELSKGIISPSFVELLACSGGCINGPAIDKEISTVRKKQKIKKYTKGKMKKYKERQEGAPPQTDIGKSNQEEQYNIERKYYNRKKEFPQPSEEQIQEILNSIGKYSKEDETNCGGCGYETCREKAVAVYQGLAKRKMCIPYMKSRAESLSDIIVQSSHNAIIVVDNDMIIQEFNPVANQMFNGTGSPIDKPLSRYIDPSLFKRVWEEKEEIRHHKVEYEEYELITDQTIFPLEEYGVIVGIFTDKTAQEQQKEEMREMKQMAADKAADVVHKQMEIVQEIAGLLGETTVETKTALYELTELIQEGD